MGGTLGSYDTLEDHWRVTAGRRQVVAVSDEEKRRERTVLWQRLGLTNALLKRNSEERNELLEAAWEISRELNA